MSFLDTLGYLIAPPILAAVSALMQALGDVFAKRAVGSVSPRMFLTIRWGISAILNTLLVTSIGAWTAFTWDWYPVLLGIAGGIGGPVIAWLCFSRALQILDVSVAGPTRSISVVLAVFLSIVLLGERLHVGIVIGVAMLLYGIYLVQSLPRKQGGAEQQLKPEHPDRARGILLALTAGILWGFVSVTFKLASEAMPVIEAAWFRTTVPAVVFAGALAWTTTLSVPAQPPPSKPSRWSLIALLAIVASSLTTDIVGWSLRFAAYRAGDLAILAPLDQTGPIWVAAFAGLFLRERMPLRKLAGIALVVAGAIAITFPL